MGRRCAFATETAAVADRNDRSGRVAIRTRVRQHGVLRPFQRGLQVQAGCADAGIRTRILRSGGWREDDFRIGAPGRRQLADHSESRHIDADHDSCASALSAARRIGPTRWCYSADVNRAKWIVAAVALLAIVATLILLCKRSRERPVSTDALSSSAANPNDADPSNATVAAPLSSSVHDRKTRDDIRARIYASRGQTPPDPGGVPRSAGVSPAPTAAAPAPLGSSSLDKEYIRDVVRSDFYPMAKQCYEAALATNPKLAGKLVVFFTIVGDEKVGGIVESAELVEGTTIDDPKLAQCFAESMKTVAFKAPRKGGMVTVKYPFDMSPDEPDAAAAH